jgi:hypothetical protein
MRQIALLASAVLLFASDNARADDDPVAPASGVIRRPLFGQPNCPPVQGSPIYPPGVCPPLPGDVPGTVPDQPPVTPQPGVQPGPAFDIMGNRLTTPFATQTGAGGFQGRSFNEEFDGDMGGMFYSRTAVLATIPTIQQVGSSPRTIFNNSFPTRVTVPVYGIVPVTLTRQVLVPVAGRYSGIQITDNDSARPEDRVYFTYNYFDNFGSTLNSGLGNITQNRETMGFEKSFMEGNASIGLRLPFVQLNAPGGLGADAVGDLSVLFKYAIINNRDTGNVLSAGLILTTPTSRAGGLLSDGTTIPHSVLFQPWVGFVRNFDRAYVQGISEIIVPTDGRDTILLGNSVGVGYWLYSGNSERFIPGITPTAEIHVRTPLNNRDPDGLVYLQDQVNITGGLHFRWKHAVLSGSVGVPVVGPRPWNLEAIANVGIYF